MNCKIRKICVSLFSMMTLSTILTVFWSHEIVYIRLPLHIWPLEYNITIQVHMDAQCDEGHCTFSGDVHIRIRSVIPTKKLVMHSKDLNYTSIEYWAEHVPLLKRRIEKVHFEADTHRMKIELQHNIEPAFRYILHFVYQGSISNVSNGFFYKKYKEANNQTRWMVGTYFQPCEAHRTLPCFDEPQFKATFRVVIIRPWHMKSYSNTRLLCSYRNKDHFIDTFHPTPKMPVYTLAFVIASYAERNEGSFAVISRSEKFNQTQFSVDVGTKILNVFGQYFDLSYDDMGIDKMALVAVPDVNFRAIENWGLVLLSEYTLIYEPDKSTESMVQRQGVALILGHELAHMWFGNLVTCDWWTSVWLNEGFATYFAYFILEMLDFDFTNSEELFDEHVFRLSLSYDVGDVLPINAEADHLSRDYFRSLTYKKGASILHMSMHIVGRENFQNFIRKYLRTNQYKTVTFDSFLNGLRGYWPSKYEKYLLDFLKSYVEQKGFPLITFNLFENGTGFEITQERFPQNHIESIDPSYIYTVPISYTTNTAPDFVTTTPDFFISTAKETHSLSLSSPAKWLISNIKTTYYYRTNYNDGNWLSITEALHARNWSGIPVLNRVQIVDDVQYLFCVGRVSARMALRVLGYLSTETSYLPWHIALKYLESILRQSDLKQQEMKAFMRSIINLAYTQTGFVQEPSSHLPTQMQYEQIVPLACKYGVPGCLNEAKLYYEEREKLEGLPPYLRSVVYCTVVREGPATIYEELLQKYRNETDEERKQFLMRALGCVNDPDAVEKQFWIIMSPLIADDQKLRSLEYLYTASDSNGFRVYKFIALNYANVSSTLGEEIKAMTIISNISKRFKERIQKQDLRDFAQYSSEIQCEKAKQLLQHAIQTLDESRRCF